MRDAERRLGLSIAALLCFAVAVMAQRTLDRNYFRNTGDELLYLPSERLLTHFTAGFDSVLADLLWIQCIQYVAKEAKGERGFTWLRHMLELVTRLDPYFVDAYRYGGIFLAALKADDRASLSLLERGMERNPDAWALPYEAAMVYLLNRRDWSQSRVLASHYLAMSAATGRAPAYVVDVAAKLQGQYDLIPIEEEMWATLAQQGQGFMREMAQQKLKEVEVRKACRILTSHVQRYRREAGKDPETLHDLVARGYLAALPSAPLPGEFIIDTNGEVKHTFLVEEQIREALEVLRNAIQTFHQTYGEYPKNLDELVRAKILQVIPPHPLAAKMWTYDPERGMVE